MNLHRIMINILEQPEVDVHTTNWAGYRSGFHFVVNGVTISSQTGWGNYHEERHSYPHGETPENFWFECKTCELGVWSEISPTTRIVAYCDEDALISAIIQAQNGFSVENIMNEFERKGFSIE